MSYSIQKDKSGRYNITIPKKFMDGFGWEKGDNLEFEIVGEGELNIKESNKS